MLKLKYLQELLMISIALSIITCAIIQKTKGKFKNNKYILLYSFIINIISGIFFCHTFTSVSFPTSLWIGLFSFLGADTIYKSLKGHLSTYEDLTSNVSIPKENLINKEEE